MAVVRQRVPSSGAPTSEGVASPVYPASSPFGPTASAQAWTQVIRSPLVSGSGTYTGTIAVPRGADLTTYLATPEAQAGLDRAALYGAAQRAQRAGLPADVVPIMADIFRGRGYYPDLGPLTSGTGFGPFTGPQFASAPTVNLSGTLPGAGGFGAGPGGGDYSTGGVLEAGLGPSLSGGLNTWIILSIIGVALLLLFGPAKGRR